MLVEINGYFRQLERIVLPVDRAAEVTQQIVVHARESAFILKLDGPQPAYLKERAQHVFKARRSRKKLIKRGPGRTLPPPRAIEHPPLEPFLGFDGRQICQGQEVIAFEVRALIEKLLAAFIVDHARRGIREAPVRGIPRGPISDGIAVDHPPAAQPQDGVEPRAQGGHLLVRCRGHIRAAEGPCRQ